MSAEPYTWTDTVGYCSPAVVVEQLVDGAELVAWPKSRPPAIPIHAEFLHICHIDGYDVVGAGATETWRDN